MAKKKLEKKSYKEFKYAKMSPSFLQADNRWAIMLPCGNVLFAKATNENGIKKAMDDLEKEKDKIKNKKA